MANLNKVMLVGNVTRDPELRYTPNGAAVTEFSIAVNQRYTAENGEKRESVTFVELTAWNKTAELAGEYLKKGSSVFIEGRLVQETWDDKATGQKRSKMKVVIENMQFLGEKQASDQQPRQQESRSAARPQPTQRPPKPPVDPDLDVDGDDIPF